MSRYRKVELHLRQLEELQSIITSMKTLSQLELHKLSGYTESQGGMTEILEQMASDFHIFFPRPAVETDNELLLIIGSERGFCGGFNELLVRHLFEVLPACAEQPERVLAVGHKLCWRLDEKLPGYKGLAGACASEEIQPILSQVVGAIREQLILQDSASLWVLYHSDERGNMVSRRVLPPEYVALSKEWYVPPKLYLEPELFFSDFLHHYLLLGLTRLFTVSLLAENRHRVQHLSGAMHRLDERLTVLTSKARSLRQEEITEEIEMILLGSGAFDAPG
ncbi:F0F1 ATP synthase subunit gamma [Desulfosediminicola flagellatus]|uniref:F0F1 ATP synthase subunit gamma n=1 Tax=Desulfosediminicola flagellatus TaxID=2569541 RepID=UPI00142F0C05|nr:F0F1 ATP synthase subunit gamma [Desulfosediminicola flagellatus]